MNIWMMLPLARRMPGPFRLLSWFRMAPSPLPDEFLCEQARGRGRQTQPVTRGSLAAYSIHTEGLGMSAISYGTTADTCVLLA